MDTHVLTPQQQHALALEKQLQLQLAGGPTSGRNIDSPAGAQTGAAAAASPHSSNGLSSAGSLALSPMHAAPSHPSLQLPSPSPSSSQSIMSPGPQSPTQTPLSYVEAMLLMTKGDEFVKYASTSILGAVFGRTSADARYVFYEKTEGSMGKIYWCKPGMRTKDEHRCIPLAHVTELYEQAETGSFGSKLKPADRACCFSIVCGPKKLKDGTMTKGRTLDLKAKTVAIRDTWMHCIHQILVHSGYGVHEKDENGAIASPVVGNRAPANSPTSASEAAHVHGAQLNREAHANGRVGEPEYPSSSPEGIAHIQPSSSPLGPMGSPQHVNWLASPIPNNEPLPLEDQVVNAPMKSLRLQTSPTQQTQAQKRSGLESVVSSPAGIAHTTNAPQSDAKVPDALVYDDPLVQSKLILSLSPTSNAELGMPHDAREIPASMTVPTAAPAELLSPSERPTQTPMPSPIGPA